MSVLYAFLLGLGVGLVFGAAKLEVPAPPTFAGVAGILGITVGWLLVRRLR